MPSLRNHHGGTFVKLLLMGDSKTRKTSSLLSLVKAGFKLRIIDTDNLLDGLFKLVMRDCPELADNVEYRTLRDERTATSMGMVIKGTPRAYTDAIKMLDRWKYDDVDLGSPAEWGADSILVIDSLSRLCDAAYDWREALAPKSGKGGGQYDGRAVYGDAQDTIESILAGLTSETFRTNVIIIAHLQYLAVDNKIKGYPQGVGQKLSPKIPQYFPSVVMYQRHGDKYEMFTASTATVDLANPAPFAMSDTYPTETGLAEFFRILREQPNEGVKPDNNINIPLLRRRT